jgi:hypothetical protein
MLEKQAKMFIFMEIFTFKCVDIILSNRAKKSSAKRPELLGKDEN